MRGHVRKRGKKWCFVLDIGRDPETGKRKQKWFSGFNTKKEAEKEMVNKMNELEKGTFISSSKLTFSEYLDNWLQDYAKGSVGPTTFQLYSTLIRTHIIPSLGAITLEQLQAPHIQRFYNNMLEKGRIDGNGGVSPAYIQRIHSVLRRSLGHAVKWQLLTRNVALLTEPPKVRKKEITTFEIEEVKQFLTHSKDDRLYIAFVFAITTGLRRGEILGLRWKDINMETNTASIRKNLVLVKGKPTLQEPKTNGSVRLITLPSMIMQVLKDHKKVQNQEKSQAGEAYQDNGLIIATSFGTPVDPTNLVRSFKRILKASDLPNIRFHDLRHTHATLMLKQGEHPKIVSERLGHSNTRITMDIYSHVLPNMQQEAVDRFEKMLLRDGENEKI
ncbi:site-specific integrase [Hazenella sp. IB182357]|uniref:Site-specific integrase n=1 Tax=Polycladospora coralii TaxID=2771432 RepID=A0A926RSI1_9BACL|nr:site-specific integrase [Polycladospora coralii]MBD1371250.1 site-specific integrase [Polycladospora coralii]